MKPMSLPVRDVRRLALARAGLLKPEWTQLPSRVPARGGESAAQRAALLLIERFGYLQLDTVSVAGARSHALVLLSRLAGYPPKLGESLLQPGAPLFEFWGHEASWIPLDMYPLFEFRRNAPHPWWGDVLAEHPKVAKGLLARIRAEGPLRSIDMEGRGSRGWWDLKLTKRVATALWSSGQLSILERKNFQRAYELTERVIPKAVLARRVGFEDSLDALMLKALDGHGWAGARTLAATWRVPVKLARASLLRLQARGEVLPCEIRGAEGAKPGWIRPVDLELAARLRRCRPRTDEGVLLSPFDPVLWDRARVKQLFGFDQILEIFKPEAQRTYGYFCMPVLAGERLIARYDLKAYPKQGRLQVRAFHLERDSAEDRSASAYALNRYSKALKLSLKID